MNGSADRSHSLRRIMTTAEERMAPRVPGGDRPQEISKNRALTRSEDPLFDAVNGAFISALLQHALDNLSATSSASKVEDKSERPGLEPKAATLPRPGVCDRARPRERRISEKTSRRCITNLTASPGCSSKFFADRSEDRIHCYASRGGGGGQADVDQTDCETRNTDTICVSEEGQSKAKIVVAGTWLQNEPKSAFSVSRKTDTASKNGVKAADASTAVNSGGAQEHTPASGSLEVASTSKYVCPSVAALLEVPGGVEAEDSSAGGMNDASASLRGCCHMGTVSCATRTGTAGGAATEAETAALPCSTLVTCHTSTRSNGSSASLDNAQTPKDATADGMRQTPLHILFSRLCNNAGSENCVHNSGLLEHEERVLQTQFDRHQHDSKNATSANVQGVQEAQPHTLTTDVSSRLPRKCGPAFADEGPPGTLQGLLVGRPPAAGARELSDLPGALLQQQSVGRALLTRLASLQVQQALLRCTATLPHFSSQAAALRPMHEDGRQGTPFHDELQTLSETDGNGSRLSQQLSHGEWPSSAANEECSTFFPTHLQHSEILSLMQNHTACVFHFVIRALSLLANCCPLWAAAGQVVATVHAGASVAYNFLSDNGEAPRTTLPKSCTSKENGEFVVVEVHNGEEASAVTCPDEKNPTDLGMNAEVLPASYFQDWIISTSSRRSISKVDRKDGSEDSRSTEPPPRRSAGYVGISSYRWHWMHIISFLTHPELLSVYHSVLAPLLSLFVPSAQAASGKRCARIESLDTSSSHEDETSLAAEHSNDKAPQPTSQRPLPGPNSTCCGAGSWLVVRQVLSDLDDLRFLHDSSFAPCPQRQDPSYCAHLQQQQMKLRPHYHQANCTVLTQGSPLLCCNAPKCSERCPGAFYCGTALLRSSIFFGSFFEALQALAVWPQYLAATAAAALPLSPGTARWDKSAFLTTEERNDVSRPSFSGRHRHKREVSTKEPGAPAVSPQRRQWSCEQGAGKSSRVAGEHASNMRAELSDAARGVAACILKHVDLNKLDSTELLALLKLTEEAGSPSPLSPCEERHQVDQEAGRTYSAITASATPGCNWSLTHVAPFPQSAAADALTPSGSTAAFKRRRGDLDTDLDVCEPGHSPRNMCSASVESYPLAGGSSVEAKPDMCGGDVPGGTVVRHRIAPFSVHTVVDRATSAKRANQGPDSVLASSLIADRKAVLTEEDRKTLLRFSPLFTPRQPQPRSPTLSAFDQADTLKNEVKRPAMGLSDSRGQQQPVDNSFCPSDSALCDFLFPGGTMEKPGHLALTAGVDRAACPKRAEKDAASQDSVRYPEAGTRETLLALAASAVINEPGLPQLAARCQPSAASPLLGPFSASPVPAADASNNRSHNEIVCRADCKPSDVQRVAGFVSQETMSEALENEQVAESCNERSVLPQPSGPDILGLAGAATPSQQSRSEVGVAAGTNCLTADEGNMKERKGEGRRAVSALDIVEHERALSLVAAGVRNTRKRFRLQSERRKAEARFHFDMPCMTLCRNEFSWGKDAVARIPVEETSVKEQQALAASQSPPGPIPGGVEERHDSVLSRPAALHVSGGISAAARRNGGGTTSVTVGSSHLSNGCNVRSPVKGIYYDSYKKLWRVQWNCISGACQSATTNASVNAAAQSGAGRRVSRSFSCARLGFEAAKARAVAWMLSGGHVGDGGLADGVQRASADNRVDSNLPGSPTSGVTGANRSTGKRKHELEKTNSASLSKTRQAMERQDLAEREQKERLLFDNPKLFLERVEAFYVRNGLYGLQCGNGSVSGPAERYRGGFKESDEQQHSSGASFGSASNVGNSRKGNGGTGGLRIVSVLSLDDMLDIVQGKKTTMSFPHAPLKHTSPENRGKTELPAIALAADHPYVIQAEQRHVSQQVPTVQKCVPSHSQVHKGDFESKGEYARKKSRSRVPEFAVNMKDAGHKRASGTPSVEQTRGADTDAERAERERGVAARLVREAEASSQTENANDPAQNVVLCVTAAVKVADQEGRWGSQTTVDGDNPL